MTRDHSGPHEGGAPTPRPETDTFRPAAGDAEDAYSAETVVKAIPRELLADLAKALKAPAVPKLGDDPKSSPKAVPKPTRSAAPTPRVPFTVDPLGDDDRTVIDHRTDRDLSELDFDSPPPSKPLPVPAAAATPIAAAPAATRARASDETPDISIIEPAPRSKRDLLPPPSGPGADLPTAPVALAEAPPSSTAGSSTAGSSTTGSSTSHPPTSQPLARPSSADIDENTDFRAGTRWPWITAIILILISFAVTLTILRNL